MTTAEPMEFPTPIHREVHLRLVRVVGIGAGELFLDACRLYAVERPFLSSTNLIWHLSREVLSAVRRVLAELPLVREELEQHDGKSGLAKELRDTFTAQGLSGAQVEAIVATLRDHNSLKRSFSPGSARIYNAAIDGLEVRGSQSEEAWKVALKNEEANKYAHRQGQGRARRFDAPRRREWDRFVEALHDVLGDLESHFAGFFAVASRLQAKASPSNDDLSLATQGIPHVDTVMAFLFRGLTASWLIPLRGKHFFDRAPDPIQHDNGITFPRWPAVSYLTRIASENPEEVATTIIEIAPTENAVVHEEYLRAALAMPPRYAALILTHELPWLESQRHLYGSLDVVAGQLVAHVADREHLVVAISAARILLEPRRGEGGLRHHFSARVEDYNYPELSCSSVKAIAAVDREAALALLIQLLEDAQGDDTNGEWRASIEETDQNFVEDTLDRLIALLRDQYEAMLGASPSRAQLRQVVEFLESKKHKLFWRLAIHVLRVYRTIDPDMVLARLRNPERLADDDQHHEMVLLLSAAFGDLSPVERESVLAVIESIHGPEGQAARAHSLGIRVSEEEALAYGRAALRQWYSMIEAHLDERRLSCYREQIEQHGAPEHPEFLSWHGVMAGERAPMTSAQVQHLSNEELVEVLATWTPPERGFGAPSIDGLADSLRGAATENPERFEGLARQVAQQRPVYLASLLHGVASAMRDKEKPSVFQGVLVALEEYLPRYLGSTETDSLRVLLGARSFFEELFKRWAELDDGALTQAWDVFEPLLAAWHPLRDDSAADRDRLQFAINTIRGQALDIAVDLLVFLWRSDPLSPKQARLVDRIAEAIRVRVESEECWPVLAVVAHQFNRLMGTNRRFAESLVAPLFERRPELFIDFVKWCSASGPGYDVLHRLYESAIARIAQVNDDEGGWLGKHLILLAAWGRLPIETLERFVRGASGEARADALGALGRRLAKTESLKDEERAQLQAVWDMWFEYSSATEDREDLFEFGWWFVASILDPVWRLQRLRCVLVATRGRIDREHEVVNTLAELADQHPADVGMCLRLMIERVSAGNGYAYFLGRDGLRTALIRLKQTEAGRDVANALINKIIALGILDFIDLAATQIPKLPEP